MAPTGPRDGPRRSTPRPTRGGGISKTRGPTKTDRDGDVAMDAPAAGGSGGRGARGGGRGRGGRDVSRGTTRASSRLAQNARNYVEDRGSGPRVSKSKFNRATLKVLGLKDSKAASNPDGGRRSLLDFLERKASKDKQITIGKTIMEGDYVWISVNKEDVADLLRLSGYHHAGAPITITETDEKMPNREEDRISREAEETKKKLTEALVKRYNAEQKLLDLSALGADDILSSMGTFDSQTLAEKAFRALVHLASSQYKTAAEKNEALQAVSIARNDINDVGQVFQLAHSLPGLKRLDLSNNNLDTLSKISKWQHRFKHLAELHLTGNSVTAQPNYLAELLQWFPSLQILDGQQVRSPEEAAEALKALEPKPLPQFPSNVRDGDNNVASLFLQAFFPLFDSDRARLAAEFYDDEAWFSVAVIPNSGRPLPWKSYLKFSRNVHKLGSRNNAALQRLFTGGTLISDLWKALPATRHPSMDQPGQWLIDCHTFPHLADPSGQGFAMGLIINVNGQFEEADPSENLFGVRTFSRTFILGPSKPSNPPPLHPYRVISDQLTLHSWTAADAGAPLPVPVLTAQPALAALTPVAAVPPVAAFAADEVVQAQLMQELSQRTGMTIEYAKLCLEAAGWVPELALKTFEDRKADLPAEAFISAA